jgi:1-acyl-sn-glycerol-3-phosphate acyltransferase
VSVPEEQAGRRRHARGEAMFVDQRLWFDRLAPLARACIRSGYFSLEVEGLEHIPREGPVVFAQNHAGWFPLDAFFLSLALREGIGPERQPVFAAADAALRIPGLGGFIRRVGALPASWFRRPEKLPADIESFGVFPEGVQGNTKPFWHAYRMRDWNRGFVRVAIARHAPIVPVAVLGGEESLPVAWTVTALRPLVGSEFGLPLSLVLFGLLMEHAGFVPALLVLIVGSAAAGTEFRLIEVLLLAVALTAFSVALFIWGLGLPYPLLVGW